MSPAGCTPHSHTPHTPGDIVLCIILNQHTSVSSHSGVDITVGYARGGGGGGGGWGGGHYYHKTVQLDLFVFINKKHGFL